MEKLKQIERDSRGEGFMRLTERQTAIVKEFLEGYYDSAFGCGAYMDADVDDTFCLSGIEGLPWRLVFNVRGTYQRSRDTAGGLSESFHVYHVGACLKRPNGDVGVLMDASEVDEAVGFERREFSPAEEREAYLLNGGKGVSE